MGSDERKVGRFNDVIGSSRIASSAYQKQPANNLIFYQGACSIKQQGTSHPFKVWEQTKGIAPPHSLIIRFTRCNYFMVGAILREISGGTSY